MTKSGDATDTRLLIHFFLGLLGGTQEDLARESGVQASQVSQYLNGKVPRRTTLHRLAAGAGVPAHQVEPIQRTLHTLRLAMEGKLRATAGAEPSLGSAVAEAVTAAVQPYLLELAAAPAGRARSSAQVA